MTDERDAEIERLNGLVDEKIEWNQNTVAIYEHRLKERNREISALKSKLGEAEKVLKRKLFEEASFHAGGCGCFLCEFLSSLRSTTEGNLRTASDGEGKA